MRLREGLRKGLYLLGTMLVGERLTSEEQVDEALGEQHRRKQRGWSHKRLGELLIDMSAVSREDVDRVLEQQRKARQAAPSESAAEAPADRQPQSRPPAVGAVPVAEARQADAPKGEPAPDAAPAVERKAAAAQPAAPPNEAPFVASVQGKVYHRRSCDAVRRINPANLTGFDSRANAEQEGKRPCSKCC